MKNMKQLNTEELNTLLSIFKITKASIINIVICTILSILCFGVYFYTKTKTYEATANIKAAIVANVFVESPGSILEKIELKIYDTGIPGGCNVLKVKLHKESEIITISSNEKSLQNSKACLETQLTEMARLQNELSKPLIDEKKEKLKVLKEALIDNEKYLKALEIININEIESEKYRGLIRQKLYKNSIKEEIIHIERDFHATRTHPLIKLSSEVSVNDQTKNKAPIFFFGISLFLGIIMGLLVTIIKIWFAQFKKINLDN